MKYLFIFSALAALLSGCASMNFEKTAPCKIAYAAHSNTPCNPLPVNIARAPLGMERHS